VVFGFRRAEPASHIQERRRAPRVEPKRSVVKIDSKIYTVKNLSTRGFVLTPYEGDLVAHQRVYLTLVLPVGGEERDFATDAVVVRRQSGTLAARFNDLRRDARRAIELLFQPKPARQPG
jgi:hypothetical protein